MTSESHRICPVSAVGQLDNALRGWLHPPQKLFGEVVKPGMRCLDFGCGGGFVSMGLARLVGPQGEVIAADCQPGMLDLVRARAAREGHTNVSTLLLPQDTLELPADLDVVVMFYVAHEVPNARNTLHAIHSALSPRGRLFLAEPPIHVRCRDFEAAIQLARDVGFSLVSRPRIFFAHAAWLEAS